MTIPRLSELAAEQVIANIYAGVPNPPDVLDGATSNHLLHTLCPFYYWFPHEFYSAMANTLNATKLHLGGTCVESLIPFVQSQNLTHLRMGDFFRLQSYHTDKKKRRDWKKYPDYAGTSMRMTEHRKEIRYFIDIHAVLRDMLNENSRKVLVDLDLSPVPSCWSVEGHEEQFIDRWVTKIASLLPSLKSLNIRQRLTTTSEFKALCGRFQGLQLLDLTNTDIVSLSGIGQLKDLQTLRIGCLKLKDNGNFDEIFELENIKILSFEATWTCPCCQFGNTIDLYLASGKSLPNVEHLDFSMNIRKTTNEETAEFVRAHPSLKSISLCGTFRCQVEYPGIEVYHNTTLSGAIKALHFYLEMKNQWMVTALMNNLKKVETASVEDARACLKVVNSAVEEYGFILRVQDAGTSCYMTLMESHPLDTFPEEDKTKMLNIILNNLTHDLGIPREMQVQDPLREFDVLNNRALLREVSHRDVQRICRCALIQMENMTGYGRRIPHAMVLDILSDRMDPTSKIFEGVQKEKILEYLTKVQTLGSAGGVENAERILARVGWYMENNF